MLKPTRGSARGTRRALWFAVAVSAVAGLASVIAAPSAPAAPLAQALPGYHVVNTPVNVELAAGQEHESVARCPGQFVLGGGVTRTNLSVQPPPIALVGNGKDIFSPADRWVARWINRGTTAFRLEATVRAICIPERPSSIFGAFTEVRGALAPGMYRDESTPNCTADEVAISGGYHSRASGPLANLLSSAPHGTPPANWMAAWGNPNAADANLGGNLSTLCADRSRVPVRTEGGLNTPGSLPPGQSATHTVHCPGHALGGGAELWHVSPNERLPLLAMVENGPVETSPTQWRVTYVNYGTTPLSIQYYPYAICSPG
jgi:hypothetical protein